MADNFKIDFDKAQLKRVLGKIGSLGVAKGNLGLRRLSLGILKDAVLDTRVDTGRARGNWQISRNLRRKNTTDRRDSNKRGKAFARGSGKSRATSNTIAEADRELELSKPSDTIYIQNNVPYIKFLESKDKMLARAINRNIGSKK